jgi:chromosome segregation ATPase
MENKNKNTEKNIQQLKDELEKINNDIKLKENEKTLTQNDIKSKEIEKKEINKKLEYLNEIKDKNKLEDLREEKKIIFNSINALNNSIIFLNNYINGLILKRNKLEDMIGNFFFF